MGALPKEPSELLRSLGMKVTKNREQVIRILKESKRPLNHQEIMDRLPKGQSWDRVTIYRALADLEEKNIITTMLNHERITFFELKEKTTFDKNNHGHTMCGNCGKVECVPLDEIALPKSVKGFKISGMEITFHGLCRECQK